MRNCSHMLDNKDVQCVTTKTSKDYTCSHNVCIYLKFWWFLALTRKALPSWGYLLVKLEFHLEMIFIVFELN